MTGTWLHELAARAADAGPVVRVTVVKAAGSSPRGAGAGMTVFADGFTGTIGGGELEFQALETARGLLGCADGDVWLRDIRTYPLGPSLGQCCGGRVTLMFEVLTRAKIAAVLADGCGAEAVVVRPLGSGNALAVVTDRKEDRDCWPLSVRRAAREMLAGVQAREAQSIDGYFVEPLAPPKTSLFLYGAGHVGRAAVRVLADLPFQVYWVDTNRSRFPVEIPDGVECVVAADPAHVAAYAPDGAWHVVMTFSHALDLDICRQVMGKGTFAYLGVIASKTKRERFTRRLREEGIPEAVVARLHAPIGLPGIEGKEPAIIAVSLSADLLMRLEALRAQRPAPTMIEGEP